MEWVVLVVLVVLLLGAFGPRAGLYGTATPIWDTIGLILLIIAVIWLLRVLNILVF